MVRCSEAVSHTGTSDFLDGSQPAVRCARSARRSARCWAWRCSRCSASRAYAVRSVERTGGGSVFKLWTRCSSCVAGSLGVVQVCCGRSGSASEVVIGRRGIGRQRLDERTVHEISSWHGCPWFPCGGQPLVTRSGRGAPEPDPDPGREASNSIHAGGVGQTPSPALNLSFQGTKG